MLERSSCNDQKQCESICFALSKLCKLIKQKKDETFSVEAIEFGGDNYEEESV